MAAIILPGQFGSQPQYPAPIDPKIGAGLVSCIMPWYLGDYARKVPATTPSLTTTRFGKAFNFTGASGISFSGAANSISIPAGSDFTCIAVLPSLELPLGNPGLFRDGVSSTGGNFCLIQGGTVRRPWIRWNSTDILKPASGPQVSVGQDVIIGFRVFSSASADVWWDGAQQHSATHSRVTGAFSIYNIGYQNAPSEYIGDIAGFWMWNRALHNGEMLEFTRNPWQMFKEQPRRLWGVSSGGSPSNNLIAENATQANTASEEAVTQDHALSANVAAQANASEAVAVTQAHVLAGETSTQGNEASEGAITVGAAPLVVDSVTQANTTSNPAIGQGHVLVTISLTQGNAVSDGALAHTLVITASVQGNSTSAASITQVHPLSVNDLAQGNLAAEIAISLLGELTVSNLLQGNVLGTSHVTATQTLAIASAEQDNRLISAALISDVIFEAALVSVTTQAGRVKKPGIPNDAPQWLRTMLEILTGRRGNRIEVPKAKTLTFSATPTKEECEALYSHIQEVRNSLEQLINRQDS